MFHTHTHTKCGTCRPVEDAMSGARFRTSLDLDADTKATCVEEGGAPQVGSVSRRAARLR